MTVCEPDRAAFAAFVHEVEPRLLHALVACYGPVDGREATVDALSWAWEHWDQLAGVANEVGYLYRVGQSATRRFSARPIPHDRGLPAGQPPDVEPGLPAALAMLPDRQRTVVVLVHGFGWTQAEVAELLEIGPSTVHEHLARALGRLRTELGVSDAC